jgi:hypothetical protein
MSRVPQKFRRTEVVRAIRAAETAGLKVAGVENRANRQNQNHSR